MAIGMRAIFEPVIDDRKADKEVDELESKLTDVEEISPDVSTDNLETALNDVEGPTLEADADVTAADAGIDTPEPDIGSDAGGLMDSLDGGLGDLGGMAEDKMGIDTQKLASDIGGKSGQGMMSAMKKQSGPAMTVALGGAVALGMLKGITRVAGASPAFNKMTDLFSTAMGLFFRPFGDALAELIRPAMTRLIGMASSWNEFWADPSEHFEGLLAGSLGGALAGGAGGAKAGGALGAAAGSIVPGLGTAIGGLIGSISGAIVGALAGAGIGGMIGAKLQEVIDGTWPGWPNLSELWPGWPSIDTEWPGWPKLGELWPGWPSIDREWPGWPSIDSLWPGWPSIDSLWPGWPDVMDLWPGWPSINVEWPGWPSINVEWPGWPEIKELWPGWPSIKAEWPGWPDIKGSWPGWPDIPGTSSSNDTSTNTSSSDEAGPPSQTMHTSNDDDNDDGIINTIGDTLSSMPGGPAMSPIPSAATGGIVRNRSLIEAGEREPEAIIPMSELGGRGRSSGAGRSGRSKDRGGGSTDVSGIEQRLDDVVRELKKLDVGAEVKLGGRTLIKQGRKTEKRYENSREVLR